MNISLEDARRLFPQAYAFDNGIVPYLDPKSEIRQIAQQTFGKVYIQHLQVVIAEIYKVLASAYMTEHPL